MFGASGCDQWVGPVDAATGCDQWVWIYCLSQNEVSLLLLCLCFGSLIPTFCSIFVNCFSLFIYHMVKLLLSIGVCKINCYLLSVSIIDMVH